MSRRSSFGYNSYNTRAYSTGSRSSKRTHNPNKMILIISVAALFFTAASMFVVYYFLLGGNKMINNKAPETSTIQTSQKIKDISEGSQTSKQVSEESSEPEKEGHDDGNVFIYDSQGYEKFYGSEDSAKNYAELISSIKETLGDKINVFNMVVPTHAAFGLPKKYLDTMSDEKENIDTIYSSMSDGVKTIDVYKAEKEHKSEYIYFKTDTNWTALGAYYAYEAYCETAGLKPTDISELSTGTIENFKGSLYHATITDENPDGNKELAKNEDTVTYYNMNNVESCLLLENGKWEEEEVPLIAYFASGVNSYSAFIWGDNPYMKISTSQKTGRKLCVIKDSYGCALVPFLTDNYDEIFVVDPRYYEGNTLDYVKENGYTDVLIINNIMSANTSVRLSEIRTII